MSSAKNQVEFEAVLSTHQTVFSFTSGHILVCCQNIILVRKFFFVEIVGLSSAISTLTFISRVLPVCLCARKEKV